MNDQNGLLDERFLDDLEPSATRDLLRQAVVYTAPPPGREVFVNRTLRMEKIRFIGFDLDWTLADYRQDAMSQLAFEHTLERLVQRCGYDPKVLEVEFRGDFARRGLMIDTEAGTVLKMNRHRYVGRAYSGRRFLDADQRGDRYRREPVDPGSDRFYFVDTLFELPEVNLFAELIELQRTKHIELPPYPRLFRDIRGSIDGIHADGTLKREILSDLPCYLPVDPHLILALKRLALGGRKLLLITNSEWFFTDGLCSHLFNGSIAGLDSWRDLFDLVIVDAAKPGFFRKRSLFRRLDERGRTEGEVAVPEWGGIYSGGSREGLMELLRAPGEQMLYVGDHIYSDILSSKLTSTWRTALVVRELEDELLVRRELTSQVRHLDVLRSEFIDLGRRIDDLRDVLSLYQAAAEGNGHLAAGAPQAVERTRRNVDTLRSEHKMMRRHAGRLQKRISDAINPNWGSIFKQGTNKSFFGSQVDDFACLYTSRVSNFAFYGSNHYHRVKRDSMMHETDL